MREVRIEAAVGCPMHLRQWWAYARGRWGRARKAATDEQLVGAAGLSFEQRERTLHKARLFGMYVRNAFRCRGIGKGLVEQVIDEARPSGRVEVIQLTVSESNHSAQALYASCGFEPFGTEPMALKIDQSYVAKVHMWLPVLAEAL